MLGLFFIYLIKSAICLLIFSLFFRLLLLSDTFVRFSRGVLLGGILLCLLLPFVKLHIEKKTVYQQPIQYVENLFATAAIKEADTVIAEPMGTPVQNESTNISFENTEQSQNIVDLLVLIYIIGVVFMLGRLLFSFYNLWYIVRKGKSTNVGTQRLIVTQRPITAFSFFGIIMLSEKDYEENPSTIITHEQMHNKYGHSLDALFLELVLVLQWFNVGVWSLRGDLRALHEYEADRGVIRKGIDSTKYQMLLVKKAVGERCFTSVANSFNHSLIKNRITMMLKKKTNPWARLKVLLMLPLAVGMLYAFAQPAVEKIMDTVQDKVYKLTNEKMAEDNPKYLWEQMVIFRKANGLQSDKQHLKVKRYQIHAMFINKSNQVLFNQQRYAADFEKIALSNAIQSKFYKVWKLNDEKGKFAKSQFFSLTFDFVTDTKAIFKVLDAIKMGYEKAVIKIANEQNKSYDVIAAKIPLLVQISLSKRINIEKGKVPPPPPITSEIKKQLDLGNKKVIFDNPILLKSVNNGKVIFNFKSSKYGLKESLDWYKKYEQLGSVTDVLVCLGQKFSDRDIAEIRHIIKSFPVSKIQFLYADFDNRNVVIPQLPPLPKQSPTTSDLQKWQNPAMYGVWIDDKRIKNENLTQYVPSDFSHYFVSKLCKNAKNYGKHYYQIDLMTNTYYKAYLKRNSAEPFVKKEVSF